MIVVRQLQSEDAQAYRQVFLEALRSEPDNFSDKHDSAALWPDSFWTDRLASSRFFGAFDGVTPIGIIGHFPEEDENCVHRSEMSLFYVTSSHRGTGVAKQLLTAMEAHARDNRIRQIELDVAAENPRAIGFYKREGYVEMGRVPEAAKVNTGYVDSVLMFKRT